MPKMGRMATDVERPARGRIVAAFLAVSFLWGSTYLAIRVALEGFPPFFIGAARFLVAGALLFVVARLRGERPPTAREWGSAAILGGLFFVVGNGLVNAAERSVSSGLASVLVATMPLWATVFSRFAGTRVSRGEVAGVVLGFAGVVVLRLGGDLSASGAGVAFALIAPMGWALGSVLSRRLAQASGTMTTSAQMLCGGAGTLIVSVAAGEHPTAAVSVRAVAAAVYLAVFGSLVGFTAYTFLLRHTRPAVPTSYAYVNPAVALLLGVLLGGEHVGVVSVVGTAIVLAAVLVVTRFRNAPTGSAPRSPAESRGRWGSGRSTKASSCRRPRAPADPWHPARRRPARRSSSCSR
jgi:drug/metabolite transporter (DMT)-like permease